jgi:hypothetical protein
MLVHSFQKMHYNLEKVKSFMVADKSDQKLGANPIKQF